MLKYLGSWNILSTNIDFLNWNLFINLVLEQVPDLDQFNVDQQH